MGVEGDADLKAELKPAQSENASEKYLPWHLLFTRNAFINYALWAISVYVGHRCGGGWAYLFVFPVHFCTTVFFLGFFAYVVPMYTRGFAIDPFDGDQQTQWLYEFMKLAAADPYGKGVDLGFNFYDGDYTRTPEQAQSAKFEFAWRGMGLEEGMRVLDIGCGFGDWLHWLKTEKKCSVIGINMTQGQADVVEKRGIKCLYGRWQDFYAREEFASTFGGQFDAVSAWDTIEHYIKGKDCFNVPKITRTYRSLFKLANMCLDPKSKCGAFWTSTLHRNRFGYRFTCNSKRFKKGCGVIAHNQEAFKEWLNAYLMTITYEGCYPGRLEWSSLSARAKPEFALEKEWDKIEDYRMTSLLCSNHFGSFEFNLRSQRFWLAMPIFFLSSAHFVPIVWNMSRKETAWMWHVGGIEKEPKWDTPCKLLWQVYRRQQAP